MATVAVLAVLITTHPTAAQADDAQRRQRPNFLIILADDLGYSDLGSYGGEINTPTLDSLANTGLRFTNFYSTARCWPSRAALLTGHYPQQVRIDPVRRNFGGMPPWARMLPQYLEQAGYRSYHSGKWHIHIEDRPVADGRFDRSYRMRDHDRFFWPQAHFLDDQRLPPVERDEDYYTPTAMADHAIDFLKEHEAEHNDKPWFTYLAFTSPHFPLHAPQEDIDRYRDRYLEGWDAIRRQRLQRMKQMGLVDTRTPLPPMDPHIVPSWNMFTQDMESQFGPIEDRNGPAWVDLSTEEIFGPGEVGRALPWAMLSEEQREFQATKMAIHAAMVDRMDREIGRVMEQIEAMGDRENTVVIFISDNGASAEIIVRGDMHDQQAPPGSGESYLCLGPGWATAANTPYRLHKHYTHEGGAASPFIINWPAGIPDHAQGQLRHTPGHFIDILPTMLELAGLERKHLAPEAPPFPGRSLTPTLADDVAIERDFIYHEHAGHRGLRVDDWRIVSITDKPDRGWKLYNLADDRNELNNLAPLMPEKVEEMAKLWQETHDRYESQATRRYSGE